MKKFTAFLLVLVMVLSILPTAAFAASPASDFEYENYGRRVTIKRYIGNKPEVVIPDTIEGKPVETIGRDAFKDNPRIFSVKMPENLMEIEDDAFAGCYNLELVIFTGHYSVRYGNNNIFRGVYDAKLIVAFHQSCYPPIGENRSWLGGNFDVIDMYDHKCQDGNYSQDNKCDICGKEMKPAGFASTRLGNAVKAAATVGKAVVSAAAKAAPVVEKAVVKNTAKALTTTAGVIRSILKLF